jgi:2-polyprenyl-6-methoxyphenol hydroxylase-like FAD-dependent oxidoreductase
VLLRELARRAPQIQSDDEGWGNTTVSRQVLVVGAGIGGLATARALTGQGIDCRVVERRPDRRGDGLALNLPGNAVAALQRLGAAEEVLEVGVPVLRREYRTSGGRLMFAIDEAAFWAEVAPSVCAPHAAVLDALAMGLPVERGLGATAVHRQSDGRVRVMLSNGDDALADFVVVADGVHSTLRAAVTSERPRPSLLASVSWRFLTENPGVSCWTAWTGHGRAFLLIPVAEGQVYAYASSSAGARAGADSAAAWLEEAYARFPEPVRRAIRQALSSDVPPYRSSVDEVRIPTWHQGRMVLIGDAAHATGPVWAEGAGMALEDAIVLAGLLADNDDWSMVGQAWEALRRARVDRVQAATDRMSRLAGLPSWLSHSAAPFAGPRAYRATYAPLRTPAFGEDLPGGLGR